ncbi:MAG: sulfurtransferase TusA family protein [Anaeromyxobacter sp.]
MSAALDLTGFACPMTWVKTRIALDRLGPGDRIAVLLARGEPADSVPRSAEEEGHRVISRAPLGGGATFEIVIEKAAERPLAGGITWP